jgi:glycerol-3-phosphate dehydrogenase (NAD(P)+)
MQPIAVLGAGSWGTALAIHLAKNSHAVNLWGHNPRQMEQLQIDRENKKYLPGIPFPDLLSATASLEQALTGSTLTLIAVPSQAFRDLILEIKPLLTPTARIAWATKGLELETGHLFHHVIAEILGTSTPAAVLSGPSFALEVAHGQPTAITIASASEAFATDLVAFFHSTHFRPYSSQDMIGVQLGGAIKNVLAIAAGLAEGLGFGANARAALITRGLSEMIRLGTALGGRPETLMGLSGVGDLILTCTDNQSRNRRFGLALGEGKERQAIIDEIGQEIEGIPTALTIHKLSDEYGIEMPITQQVYRILYENLPPAEAVANLLLREPKAEVTAH